MDSKKESETGASSAEGESSMMPNSSSGTEMPATNAATEPQASPEETSKSGKNAASNENAVAPSEDTAPIPAIVMYPDARLYAVSDVIEEDWENKDARADVIMLMNELMRALIAQPYGNHLGISAPQIGVNKRAMIVLGIPIVNPEWTPTRAPLNTIEEGCYSLGEKVHFKKGRAQYGWAKWRNPITGEMIEKKLKGLEAVVYQHELDHLNGTLLDDVEWMGETPEWAMKKEG